MTEKEIIRRLKKYCELPRSARPLSVAMLERSAGVHRGAVKEVIEKGSMYEKTRVRLEHVLKLISKNRIHVQHDKKERRAGLPAEVVIGRPAPEQRIVNIVRFSRYAPPRLERVAINPMAFEELEKQE